MKYHINFSGDAGICRAEKHCPFGGEDQHFDRPETARRAYELEMKFETKLEQTYGGWDWTHVMDQIAQEDGGLNANIKLGKITDESIAEWEREIETIREQLVPLYPARRILDVEKSYAVREKRKIFLAAEARLERARKENSPEVAELERKAYEADGVLLMQRRRGYDLLSTPSYSLNLDLERQFLQEHPDQKIPELA